ncbi:hypothetical protein PR048_006982 [Dryococelus australis]|uniref:Uncharacterized protein n=1 Tax=Dryococelus australis TaxID=614101 RepID=A0ABQ9IEN2_9NEOP|nr:hypothetical protein PR048_006982 [Dryococelus australis]
MAASMDDVCGVCKQKVKENDDAVFCEDDCYRCHHVKCVNLSERSCKAHQQGSKSDIIEALKVCVEDLKNEFEEKLSSFAALSGEVNTLREELKCSSEKIKSQRGDINLLYDYTNELEQYSKNYDVIIKGIPPSENKDCREITKKIGQVMVCDVTDRDLGGCHGLRQPKIRGMPASIVACFVQREKKHESMQKRKVKGPLHTKELGYTGENRQAFVNDDLTAYNGK